MVNYSHNDLFLKDSTITNILIYEQESGNTFGNDKIYYEELKLNESISFLQDLNFGSCNSSSITLKLRSDVGNLKGKTITVSLVLNDNTSEPFTLGTYKVQTDNLQANEGSRTVEAYDSLYDVINTDIASWYNEIYEADSAYTIANLRHKLCEHFGIEEETTTLVNDAILVEKTIKPTMLSGYDLLSNICELNGVFAHITRDNKLRYIKLSSNSPVNVSLDKYVSLDYNSFNTSVIDAVQIRQEENDIGGSYPRNYAATNGLIVEDNFLVYAKRTSELNTIAENLYNQISNISYCPINLLAKGNPSLEVGDCIRIQTKEGTYVTTFILDRELEGIQTMADKIEALGNEERDENINTIQSKFMQLKGQTATLEHTVDGLTSTVTTIEGNYVTQSELQQTSTELTAQIDELQREIDGETEIYYTDHIPTLYNYPAWDFTYNIPVNNTVQLRDDLMFEYTEEGYKKHQRNLAYNTENSLAYRFVKYNDVWGWQEVADTETALILQKITELEMTTEGLTTQVSTIEETFATKSNLTSSIAQSATEINANVSANYETKAEATSTKNSLQGQITTNNTRTEASLALKLDKTDNDQVISMINASADTITLNSNRLVVDSDNFKLTSDGKVTATGDFRSESSTNGWYVSTSPHGVNCYKNNEIVGWFGMIGDSPTEMNIYAKNGFYFRTDKYGEQSIYSWVGTWMDNQTPCIAIGRSNRRDCVYVWGKQLVDQQLFVGNASRSKTSRSDALIVGGDTYISGTLNLGDSNCQLYSNTENGIEQIIFRASDSSRTKLNVWGQVSCTNLVATGTKNRAVKTEHYGTRGLNAFETANCNFGDNGSGVIGDNGLCEIEIEKIFAETINSNNYQVFITRTSEKETSWVEKKHDRFVVHGEEGATFDWLLIAPQLGYEDMRLEEINV